MPAYTALGLITIMRAQLNDTAWWPNSDLLTFLDSAEKRFVTLAPDDALNEVQMVTIVQLTAVATGQVAASVTLPTDYYQFRLAQIRHTATGTFQTADLIPVEDFFAQAREESAGKGRAGQPVVALWASKLYVFPATASSVTDGVRLFYLKNLAGITATASTPTINETHHTILPEYAMYLAYQKIADVARANQHLESFMSYIADLYEETAGRNRSLPPTVARRAAQ